jgi:hypothetical protein
MECDRTEDWGGLIIPSVSIVADHTTLTREIGRAGVLVRLKDKLSLSALPPSRQSFGHVIRVDLVTNLRICGEGQQAGFLHWQITIGLGIERRVLFDVDLQQG